MICANENLRRTGLLYGSIIVMYIYNTIIYANLCVNQHKCRCVCVCVCVCVKGEEMDVVPLAPGPGCTANVKYYLYTVSFE